MSSAFFIVAVRLQSIITENKCLIPWHFCLKAAISLFSYITTLFYTVSISNFSNHLNPIHTKILSFWKDCISSSQHIDTIRWEITQHLDTKPKNFESEFILSSLLLTTIEQIIFLVPTPIPSLYTLYTLSFSDTMINWFFPFYLFLNFIHGIVHLYKLKIFPSTRKISLDCMALSSTSLPLSKTHRQLSKWFSFQPMSMIHGCLNTL